jgi:hypothetical protein
MAELSAAAKSALNGESCLCPDHPNYRPEDLAGHAEHLAEAHDDPSLRDHLAEQE